MESQNLYVDNGKIYISDNFKLICAKLGIKNKIFDSIPTYRKRKNRGLLEIC